MMNGEQRDSKHKQCMKHEQHIVSSEPHHSKHKEHKMSSEQHCSKQMQQKMSQCVTL